MSALRLLPALAITVSAFSQTPPKPSEAGPRVGERLPAFTLTDHNGRPRDLASLCGPKGAMIVFFRSADW